MQDDRFRRLLLLVLASVALRIATAFVVSQPGYTDAYYYADVAARVARGDGLVADFVWNPMELGTLPVASHRFWMPMATLLQAAGIATLGGALGDFRAAQAAIVIVAAFIPVVAYLCARELGVRDGTALVAAAVAALGGVFAPAWASLDNFAPAAVLGGLFFLAYRRASGGSAAAGAAAGAVVGLLYLSRAEAALFGLALLVLAARAPSRRAGIAGSLVALAIGGAWLARNLSLGLPNDLFARTALLVRYEDFFALRFPYADPGDAGALLAAKGGAVVTNAATFVMTFALVLVVPLAIGVRALWSRLEVRAWAGLALTAFLAQSLVWTLHSTRGSYFHSLAAFFPFGVALAAAGGERLLAARPADVARGWAWATLLIVAAISAFAVVQWDAAFNGGARVRAAALDAIPDGPFLAIDAAAWRWLSGRPVGVTPSDGIPAMECLILATGARSVVLEEAHFRRYEGIYQDGSGRPSWMGRAIERGPVKIFPLDPGAGAGCVR